MPALHGSAFSHKVVCYTGALGRNIKGNSDNKGDEIVFKIASKHKTLELQETQAQEGETIYLGAEIFEGLGLF